MKIKNLTYKLFIVNNYETFKNKVLIEFIFLVTKLL